MASATQQLGTAYTGSMYYINNDPVDFSTYWSQNLGKSGNPYNFWNKIGNFFSGDVTSAEKSYDKYVNEWYDKRDAERSSKATWEQQQREDTAVQRAKADYENAGFSPYAMFGSGYNAATSSAVNYASRNKYEGSSTSKSNDKMVANALKLLAMYFLKSMTY